jgi:succinate dehydrogenase/fumarate reductase flavoprotein subunit
MMPVKVIQQSNIINPGPTTMPFQSGSMPNLEAAMATFDWHKEELSAETVIGKDFRMTQNVRRFFARETGRKVQFSREFMLWMKSASGSTLADAVRKYNSA